MDFRYAIALTGGIATGKSTVGEILKKIGFSIIDLDKITHELLSLHVEDIKNIFGTKYIKDNKVDTKALANLVFSDKNQLKKLESFLHPLIKQNVLIRAKELDKLQKPYFVDIPLFFEKKGSYDIINSVLVYAPKQLQLKRLIARSNLSENEANQRIKAQMDIEKKLGMASFVIDNSLDLKHLNSEVNRLKIWIKDRYANFKI